MEREGIDAPFLCRGGACGQCETDVVTSDGEFIHRDHWLEPEEQGKKIMPCVSRFIGNSLEIDSMTIQFNKETFRDDYSFKNSDWAIKRFPFPFHEDSYMYSVNMEQHRGGA